jgi:hypothetical protein
MAYGGRGVVAPHSFYFVTICMIGQLPVPTAVPWETNRVDFTGGGETVCFGDEITDNSVIALPSVRPTGN